MIILKSETYEIRMKILKVNHYKVSVTIVIEFYNRENAIECADTIKIGIYFVNKKDNPVIIKIYRY